MVTKKMSAKRELAEIVQQLQKNMVIISAKIAQRDGLRNVLINEEAKSTGTYSIAQFHRGKNYASHTNYCKGKIIGNFGGKSYLEEKFGALIRDFLGNHKELSYFEIYSVII